jgi:hypothetical protein
MRQWTDHPLNLGHGIQKKQSVMKMMTQKKKLLVAGSGGP